MNFPRPATDIGIRSFSSPINVRPDRRSAIHQIVDLAILTSAPFGDLRVISCRHCCAERLLSPGGATYCTQHDSEGTDRCDPSLPTFRRRRGLVYPPLGRNAALDNCYGLRGALRRRKFALSGRVRQWLTARSTPNATCGENNLDSTGFFDEAEFTAELRHRFDHWQPPHFICERPARRLPAG